MTQPRDSRGRFVKVWRAPGNMEALQILFDLLTDAIICRRSVVFGLIGSLMAMSAIAGVGIGVLLAGVMK